MRASAELGLENAQDEIDADGDCCDDESRDRDCGDFAIRLVGGLAPFCRVKIFDGFDSHGAGGVVDVNLCDLAEICRGVTEIFGDLCGILDVVRTQNDVPWISMVVA